MSAGDSDRQVPGATATRARLAELRRHPGYDGPTICACTECVLVALLEAVLGQIEYDAASPANEQASSGRQSAKLPPVGEGGPFQIGGDLWPGLAKLAEECGELLQVVGKTMAYPEQNDHPDGTDDMRSRLIDEMGDVRAVIKFVIESNKLDRVRYLSRIAHKTERFRHWHKTIQNLSLHDPETDISQDPTDSMYE